MPSPRARQLALPLPSTRGGRRPGAGRKPKGDRAGVPHRTRPWHDAAHPAHVTLRARPGLPSLRAPRLFPAVRDAIAHAQQARVRICHFSVQSNHVHLLVEAASRHHLIRGVQGLAIRLARAVNRALGLRGRVWADRYHRHDLVTPREVRHALVYVLHNVKKHRPGFRGVDPCSSAPWFAGWRQGPLPRPRPGPCPVVPARTWLLAVGWRRGGPIGVEERPGQRPAGARPAGARPAGAPPASNQPPRAARSQPRSV